MQGWLTCVYLLFIIGCVLQTDHGGCMGLTPDKSAEETLSTEML